MTFDFDRPIDRRRTNTSKWDNMLAATGVSPDDGLAMWVADMDFEAPPAVWWTAKACPKNHVRRMSIRGERRLSKVLNH